MIFTEIFTIIISCFGLVTCKIYWNGKNLAHGCDFRGNDLSNARVPGHECGGKCAQTNGCTHFTWTKFNGGTCWMKKGSVSKDNAFTIGDKSAVCGLLDRLPPKHGRPFYIIAHMANSKAAVDWAVKQGANAIECDIHFDGNEKPSRIEHGPGCDCGCAQGNGHICVVLQRQCAGPKASENPAAYMQHIASHDGIALYFLDSKVHTSMGEALVKAGKALIPFMDKNLFDHGYKGKVVISSASFSTFAYVQAAAIAANYSRYAHRYFFTIDQEGENYAGVMNKLTPYTNNRVYGTGQGACGEVSNYYAAIKAAAAGKKHGENGMNYIYTVDQKLAMQEYINAGVEGIMTNQIALAKTVATSMGLRLALPGDPIPISRERRKRHDVLQTVEPESAPWGEFTNMVYCDANTWAIGFRQRVEASCGDCDDTALNALELLCGKKDGTYVKSISPHNGFWGDWSDAVRCPGRNNFLNGVSFKIEESQEKGDDTAVNDGKFACTRSSEIVASNGTPWGSWKSMKNCPRSTAICGFSLKIENVQHENDDTAANGAKFDCCAL
ncbi:unnamed protein product [Rotaria magnacalcarata]|uniref:Uncharacterized protein n=2 Tax=Rotaria magnacalcarata TaxID=392030 RepID=A0A816PFJ3_9BILA|nr:unnamed protein product [Rotaria magnacalcarata]